MELRALQDGKAKKLVGYAATYNRTSKTLYSRTFGYFREKILPGAFDGVVRKGCAAGCECKSCSVIATINHDENQVIGKVGAGTLKLKADDKGLRFEVTLPDTTYANDLYENVRAGNMSGCSFAFSSDDVDDDWDTREEGEVFDEEASAPAAGLGAEVASRGLLDKAKSAVKSFLTRKIKKFRALKDVSVVSDPAYTGTSVSARSLAAACEVRSRLGGEIEPAVKRNPPGLAEDAPRRARALNAAIQIEPTGPWPIVDGTGLVDIILEARKLSAKTELNSVEHRRFWFCVDAVTKLKKGFGLGNLEHEYRSGLLAALEDANFIN